MSKFSQSWVLGLIVYSCDRGGPDLTDVFHIFFVWRCFSFSRASEGTLEVEPDHYVL